MDISEVKPKKKLEREIELEQEEEYFLDMKSKLKGTDYLWECSEICEMLLQNAISTFPRKNDGTLFRKCGMDIILPITLIQKFSRFVNNTIFILTVSFCLFNRWEDFVCSF